MVVNDGENVGVAAGRTLEGAEDICCYNLEGGADGEVEPSEGAGVISSYKIVEEIRKR